MGFDIVSMFVGFVMFVCGLVLLLVSRGKRKGGYVLMTLGVIIMVICLLCFPRLKERTFNKYEIVK